MTVTIKSENTPATSSNPEILDLLPKVELLPWEDETQYEALKSAVIEDLKPNTRHERVLAHRIVNVYWEQSRNEVLFRDLSMATYRKALLSLMGGSGELCQAEAAQIALADSLLSTEAGVRESALQALSSLGITEEDIRSKAYLDHIQATEALGR